MARSLRVSGLACPYNVENCYSETMRPGAFDTFLMSLGGVRGVDGLIEADDVYLPMHLMHGHQIGTWNKLWTTQEGLWCAGTIENSAALTSFTLGNTEQLSICYGDGDDADGITVQRVHQAASAEHASDWEGLVAAITQGLRLERHKVENRDVTLSEISLVDEGAFPGTHCEPV